MIKYSGSFGISRVVQLKAAIEAKAVDDVGSNPASDSITGFKDVHINTVNTQLPRTGQSCESRTNNRDGRHD
jgi:hypothetical protein